jgi:hypothetical protein
VDALAAIAIITLISTTIARTLIITATAAAYTRTKKTILPNTLAAGAIVIIYCPLNTTRARTIGAIVITIRALTTTSPLGTTDVIAILEAIVTVLKRATILRVIL